MVVFVSSGLRQTVPTLRGQTLERAVSLLTRRRLQHSFHYRASNATPRQVVGQWPAGGSLVDVGSTIKLVVAQAPPSHSGTLAYSSQMVYVPKRWRIRYTVRSTGDFGFAEFTITGADYELSMVKYPGTGYLYPPEPGPGFVQIDADSYQAAWSFVVEVFD